MKMCSSCGERPRTHYSHRCRPCNADYMRGYLNSGDNRVKYNERHRQLMAEYRERFYALIHATKDVPCADCGGRFHPVAMHFDHVRGEKSIGIADMARSHYSLERVQEEMDKCDVVCANCHAVRTWERGEYGKNGFKKKVVAL